MSSTISWVGNRVLDSGTSSRSFQQTADAVLAQECTVPTASLSSVPAQTTTPEVSPSVPETQQVPPSATENGYIPNFLKRNIGKNIRAEFIVGTDQYTDRTGVLTEVGINYFVIRDVNSKTNIMCDLYSVKFVTILTE